MDKFSLANKTKLVPEWVTLHRFEGDFQTSLPITLNGLDGAFRLGSQNLGSEIAVLPLHFQWNNIIRALRLYAILEELNLFCCVQLYNNSGVNVAADLTILRNKGINIAGLRVILASFETTVTVLDEQDMPELKNYYSCEVRDFEVLPKEEGLRNISLAQSIDFSRVDAEEVADGIDL